MSSCSDWRNIRLAALLLALLGCVVFTASMAGFNYRWHASNTDEDGSLHNSAFGGQSETSAVHPGNAIADPMQAINSSESCTPRTVEAYPPDLFTLAQKQSGAILIHAFVSAWLFVALAIVCDNYFLASLEVVCEKLHLKPDVAGATFMAAGSSAPEMLASVIGVFIAQSDVGVSTIVGSAIFNNLMIVSLCGLAATSAVYLSWWPLFRDCGFYCISVAAMIAVIFDGIVNWQQTDYSRRVMDDDELAETVAGQQQQQQIEIWTIETGGRPQVLADSQDEEEPDVVLVNQGPESPFQPPVGLLRRVYWLIGLPWTTAFYLTIPDCRKPGIWRRLFVLTFLASVLWVSGLIYLLVWMVCAVGDAMGIPDTVMGLTLLSIGTCIPDALAGIFVTRSGLADMAIANSIASNVFDITACLGLPWFISTALLNPGSTVTISSSGLTYTAITLLVTIVFLLVATHANRMRVDKKLGFIFLFVYVAIVTAACLYETNVFGSFNPEPCPRQRL
uniref:Na_Ca_ex domain-containing protein n=1 Tax=Macrostomum lignano TaxID=282301 RepID=A0A1I8I2R8_9PLAT